MSAYNRIHLAPDGDAIAARICAQAARTSASVEPAARFIAGVILSALAAWALLAFLTPCQAGHLCVIAAVKPDGLFAAVVRELSAPLHRAYLRMRISAAEDDLKTLKQMLDLAQADIRRVPPQIRLTQACIDAWQLQLQSHELDRRDQ